jgi:Flp pilus assembly protein TadG
MTTRRLRRDHSGASLIEAALVLPVLFLLVLTMIDFGDWELQLSQARGAARDGARVGTLHYQAADQLSSDVAGPPAGDLNLIKSAITKRLAGQTYSLSGGTATCVRPDLSTLTGTGPCHAAIPGCDLIKVKVTWSRTAFSPFGALFGTQTVTGEAEMTIAGAPTDTSTTIGTVDSTGCP